MFTYILNQYAYAFKLSSEVQDLDLEKMKEGGVTFFDNEESFKKEWVSQTGIDLDELEGCEYLIAKDEKGKTVVVCDRGFLMSNNSDDIEKLIIDYVH